VLADGVTFYNLGDRERFRPYGLLGGLPGRQAETILNPGGTGERRLHSKGSYRIGRDDLISWRTAGGGGYGDPLQREPARVERDIDAGIISAETARRDYGIVVDFATGRVDPAATENERRRRAAREGAGAERR
jgi:N-methylhydantoinase B